MGRAAHNWRNQQKLLAKHGGASGRKGNRGNDKWDAGWTSGSAQGSWKNTDSWWEEPKVSKKRVSDAARKSIGKVKKSLLKKKASPSSDTSGKVKKARIKKNTNANSASKADDAQKPKGVKKIKKLKKGTKLLTSEVGSPEVAKKVKKLKKGTIKPTSEPGSTTKRKRIIKVEKGTAGDKPSGKLKVVKAKKIKLRKKWVRHYAHVVCPGSLTERFVASGQDASHSILTSYERRLLASGPLSWRWLRDEDEDFMAPKSRPPQVDAKAHWDALSVSGENLAKPAAERLWALDSALETDCFWPACADRVALAERLRRKGGLRRRCERYFVEVLQPLLEKSPKQVDSATEVMSQARQLLTRCATDWLAASGNPPVAGACDSQLVRHAWLQLLRRSLDSLEAGSENAPKSWHAWLSALRQAQLARLCPDLDEDARAKLLRIVTLGAPAMSEATSDDASKATNLSLVVLPLGVFTFWQALALIALTRREGRHAMLVRRKADGAAEVIFRTSEVVLRT